MLSQRFLLYYQSAESVFKPCYFLPFLQNAIVSFKELCGLSAVANLKQCILALCPRLMGPDNSPLLVFNLLDQYPYLEHQGLLPDLLKKVVTTYDLVSIHLFLSLLHLTVCIFSSSVLRVCCCLSVVIF